MSRNGKPLKKQRRFADGGNHSIVLGTMIIVIVMMILSGAALWWMNKNDMLFLPDFLENLLGLDKNPDAETWNFDELQSVVRDRKLSDDAGMRFDLTYENLRSSLLTQPREDGVYVSARISYYKNDGERARRVIYRRDGERFVISQYGDDEMKRLVTTKIGADGFLHIRDEATGAVTKLPTGDKFSPEYEAGIPSIAELLAIVARFPAEAGGSGDETVTDCELMLLETTDGTVYYIAYTDKTLGLHEEFYVALEEQIIISAVTTKGDAKIYSYETVTYLTEPEHYADDRYYRFSE